MVLRFLELPITCTDSEKCGNAIRAGIWALQKEKDANGNSIGHSSISHQQGKHQIWIFFYDNDGIHEQEGTMVEDYNPDNKSKYFRVQTIVDSDLTKAAAKVLEVQNMILMLESKPLLRSREIDKLAKKHKKVGFFRIKKTVNVSTVKASPTKPTATALEAKIREKIAANPNVEIA